MRAGQSLSQVSAVSMQSWGLAVVFDLRFLLANLGWPAGLTLALRNLTSLSAVPLD